MSCETVGIEYTNFQITRFNDYSTYLANKPAYDFYNKAAKWYEDNKDSSSNWSNLDTDTALKNIYKSLVMKKKFPMAHMLIKKIFNHDKKDTMITQSSCANLKSTAEKEMCKNCLFKR
jgi:hypothetical protein